jgi:hypothetical protein
MVSQLPRILKKNTLFTFFQRAASDLSAQKSSSVLIAKTIFNNKYFPEVLKQNGYEDLQSCNYYFAGSFNISTSMEGTARKCFDIDHQVSAFVKPMKFVSDLQVKSVMNIFQTGIFMLYIKIKYIFLMHGAFSNILPALCSHVGRNSRLSFPQIMNSFCVNYLQQKLN